LDGGAIVDIATTPDAIFAQTATQLVRIDRATGSRATFPSNGQAFSVGSAGVIVANLTGASLLSADGLEFIRGISFDGTLQLASRGDATGDDVEDLVIMLTDLTLVTLDGADFHVRTQAIVPAQERFSEPLLVIDGPDGSTRSPDLCATSEFPSGYTTPILCASSLERGTHFLYASHGRISVGVVDSGNYFLHLIASDGAVLRRDVVSPGKEPRCASAGTWLLDPNALLLGDASGAISITSGSDVVFDSQSSDRVGRFGFLMHVPEGGFYGTHLVVARLRWQEGGLNEEEAHLGDWFDVVDTEGSPVPKSNYAIGLSLNQRDLSG
jgi:hypothetical protein